MKTVRRLKPDELTPFEKRAESERARYRQWRTCDRKLRVFDDPELAKKVAHAMGCRVYKCRYCQRYHMTSIQNGTDPEPA